MADEFKVKGLENIQLLPIAKDLKEKVNFLEGITDLLTDCECFFTEAKELKREGKYNLASQMYCNATNCYKNLLKELNANGRTVDFVEEFGLEELTHVYKGAISCFANLRLDRNQFFFGIGPLGRSLRLLNPIEILYKEFTQLITKN